MRILLIHNRYKEYGGEDSVVEAEAALLQKKEHVVKLLLFDNAEIRSFTDKVKLSYSSIYNSSAADKVDEVIAEFKPDIVHVHNLFYVASASVLFAAHRNKIPVILTLHNYRLICSNAFLMRDSKPCELCTQKIFPIDGIRYKCHRHSAIATAQLTVITGVHKLLNTWSDKVTTYVALTNFARDKFVNSSLGVPSEKFAVKPNSVQEPVVAKSERDQCFLFVGRLSEEKGIRVLLKAFEGSRYSLEIIGDGPLRELVAAAVGRNSNIKSWGHRDKQFIISRLASCRSLIAPSIWYEGLPITILEAYSTGTPVIASNNENLQQVVTHGYNGLCFETGNESGLRAAVEQMAGKADYEKFCDNAKETYRKNYTHEINYKNLISIYEAAIARSVN